eukprot:5430392-Amphidinium_carterae.1
MCPFDSPFPAYASASRGLTGRARSYDRAEAKIMVYADDVVIVASDLAYLQMLLALCADQMTLMGMKVNESKSSVTPISGDMTFVPHLNGPCSRKTTLIANLSWPN